MAIHLVGETIDAKDADVAIVDYAIRIAHYFYPKAYLSSASAVLLAPTPDGLALYQRQAQPAHEAAQPGGSSKTKRRCILRPRQR